MFSYFLFLCIWTRKGNLPWTHIAPQLKHHCKISQCTLWCQCLYHLLNGRFPTNIEFLWRCWKREEIKKITIRSFEANSQTLSLIGWIEKSCQSPGMKFYIWQLIPALRLWTNQLEYVNLRLWCRSYIKQKTNAIFNILVNYLFLSIPHESSFCSGKEIGGVWEDAYSCVKCFVSCMGACSNWNRQSS